MAATSPAVTTLPPGVVGDHAAGGAPDVELSTIAGPTTNCTPEFNSSFLNHASGKAIAGLFAWAAIFVTCHQVIRDGG